jgi:hypothetical protein
MRCTRKLLYCSIYLPTFSCFTNILYFTYYWVPEADKQGTHNNHNNPKIGKFRGAHGGFFMCSFSVLSTARVFVIGFMFHYIVFTCRWRLKDNECPSDNTISPNQEVTDVFGILFHTDINDNTYGLKLLLVIIFAPYYWTGICTASGS